MKRCTTRWRACYNTTSVGCRSSSDPTKKEQLDTSAAPAFSPRASVIITKKNFARAVSAATARKPEAFARHMSHVTRHFLRLQQLLESRVRSDRIPHRIQTKIVRFITERDA